MDVILQPSPDAPADFPFEEKRARVLLGWTEDEMRAMRKSHLTDGREITLYKKRLWLNAAGVDKLFAAAGQPSPKKSAPIDAGSPGSNGVEEAEQKKTRAVETLLVVRTDLANSHMLLACKRGDDPDRPKAPLRVRVSSTANFRIRMEIPAVLVDGYTDLYELARAVPRQKGKW